MDVQPAFLEDGWDSDPFVVNWHSIFKKKCYCHVFTVDEERWQVVWQRVH